MSPRVTIEQRVEGFCAAVRECYLLAKGEEAAQLRAKRFRRFDARGIHPFSEAWGAAALLAEHPSIQKRCRDKETGLLVAEWKQGGEERRVYADPLGIKQAARADALAEFIQNAKEGALDDERDKAREAAHLPEVPKQSN